MRNYLLELIVAALVLVNGPLASRLSGGVPADMNAKAAASIGNMTPMVDFRIVGETGGSKRLTLNKEGLLKVFVVERWTKEGIPDVSRVVLVQLEQEAVAKIGAAISKISTENPATLAILNAYLDFVPPSWMVLRAVYGESLLSYAGNAGHSSLLEPLGRELQNAVAKAEPDASARKVIRECLELATGELDGPGGEWGDQDPPKTLEEDLIVLKASSAKELAGAAVAFKYDKIVDNLVPGLFVHLLPALTVEGDVGKELFQVISSPAGKSLSPELKMGLAVASSGAGHRPALEYVNRHLGKFAMWPAYRCLHAIFHPQDILVQCGKQKNENAKRAWGRLYGQIEKAQYNEQAGRWYIPRGKAAGINERLVGILNQRIPVFSLDESSLGFALKMIEETFPDSGQDWLQVHAAGRILRVNDRSRVYLHARNAKLKDVLRGLVASAGHSAAVELKYLLFEESLLCTAAATEPIPQRTVIRRNRDK